jgi:hypothetical protein
MYSEARKIRLIENVIKVKNEVILFELESVLKKARSAKSQPRPSAHDLVGVWSKEDAKLIEAAIEDGCEHIHPDDWK